MVYSHTYQPLRYQYYHCRTHKVLSLYTLQLRNFLQRSWRVIKLRSWGVHSIIQKPTNPSKINRGIHWLMR